MPRSTRCGRSSSQPSILNCTRTSTRRRARKSRRRLQEFGGGWPWCPRRLSIGCRQASRIYLRAVTQQAITATNGRKCSLPTRSRRSKKPGYSTVRLRHGFAIRFWHAAAAWTRWTPSWDFGVANPMYARCSSKRESLREMADRAVADSADGEGHGGDCLRQREARARGLFGAKKSGAG